MKKHNRVKEERSVLHTIERMKANSLGHMLRRNSLLRHDIEGNIEDGKTRKKTKQLLDDLRETRDYWKLKEVTLGRTLWRSHCGGGYGSVVQTDKLCNE